MSKLDSSSQGPQGIPGERVAIIGAGPIGLEAAIQFVNADFSVQIFEWGTVAENVKDWGHVRLFSPFEMNSSRLGKDTVDATPENEPLPADDEFLTGREYAERYLVPLSRSSKLHDCIHEQTEVVSIGRSRLGKMEQICRPDRADDPFRLLVQQDGMERYVFAEYVLDCSGVYPHHRWIGAGGGACIGERAALRDRDYRLPDITKAERSRFIGQRTLVIGSGYSAATAVTTLAELAKTAPSTQIVWLTKSIGTSPLSVITDDVLPERKQLTAQANQLATNPDSPVEWRPGVSIHQIEYDAQLSEYAVTLKNEESEGANVIHADQVIANVGYRPDLSMTEELQFHECYATQGPIKLAAALLGETSADCLSQSGQGAEVLRNPEPNYFVLGSKSYGRDPRFLIRTGLEQIQDVLSLIKN